MPEGTICKLPALICAGNSSFQSTFPTATENTTVLGLVKIKLNKKYLKVKTYMQKTFLGLMFSFAISGPVHTYPYIFENEEFFLCFRNAISVRTERIRIAFACSNVNTKTVEIDGIPYRSWSL